MKRNYPSCIPIRCTSTIHHLPSISAIVYYLADKLESSITAFRYRSTIFLYVTFEPSFAILSALLAFYEEITSDLFRSRRTYTVLAYLVLEVVCAAVRILAAAMHSVMNQHTF